MKSNNISPDANNSTVRATPDTVTRFLDTVREANPRLQSLNGAWGRTTGGITPWMPLDEPMIRFTYDDGILQCHKTQAGRSCHYLQFLTNVSNFTWRKEEDDMRVTNIELQQNVRHLLSKLCAIGYLLQPKHARPALAVTAVDARPVDGQINGGSGKSIFGQALQCLLPTVLIRCKDVSDDYYIWNDVTDDTRLVIFDDIRPGFQFQPFFQYMARDWEINPKGGRRFLIPHDRAPKIYLTSATHAFGDIVFPSLWRIIFSDFYSIDRRPSDTFDDILFFREWDACQWTLFCNLMADCILIYRQRGVIEPPCPTISKI